MAHKGTIGTSVRYINIKKEGKFKENLKKNMPPCSRCIFFKFKSFKCDRDKRSKQKKLSKCSKFMFKSNTNISF